MRRFSAPGLTAVLSSLASHVYSARCFLSPSLKIYQTLAGPCHFRSCRPSAKQRQWSLAHPCVHSYPTASRGPSKEQRSPLKSLSRVLCLLHLDILQRFSRSPGVFGMVSYLDLASLS